jgi:hypothetical protein
MVATFPFERIDGLPAESVQHESQAPLFFMERMEQNMEQRIL